ncbi:MAG: hypothetical protein V7459_17610 [Oceanicoccus sp.]
MRWLSGALLLSAALAVGVYGLFLSIESDVDSDSGVLFSQDTLYVDECGACHMAYPPGLLPKASWQLLLEHLDDHFGDNAELAEAERVYIGAYLQREALQYGKLTTMSRMLRNLPKEPFLRITELPNFVLDHQGLVADLGGESTVESFFGDCEACHGAAVQGRFSDPESSKKTIKN